MKAIFVELPVFTKYRPEYLNDEGFRGLQKALKDMLKRELEARR